MVVQLTLHSAKAIWDFEGIYCTSRHIPHVKFAGLIHPGILGCAPSPEVLATWNEREGQLIASSKLEGRDVALPPLPHNCHPGGVSTESVDLAEKIGREGARTVPGRPEHGGNCDIKNLSRMHFALLLSCCLYKVKIPKLTQALSHTRRQ